MAVHIRNSGETMYALPARDADLADCVAKATRDHRRGFHKLWRIEVADRIVYASNKAEAMVRLRELAAAAMSRGSAS